MNEEVSGLLRDAAEAHQPDRARIRARMERGMTPVATRHRGPWGRSWPKAALASLATAGILTASFAVAAVVRTPPPRPDIATAPTSAATASPAPSIPPTGSPAPTAPAGSPSPAPTGRTRVRQGPLSSDGSVDPHSTIYWAQSNLTLTTTRPLTTLTVELRIAQTGGVQTTGYWQTLPANCFTVTTQERSGALVYRWTLKPGCSVPPGQHVFAGQYNHATGLRGPEDDTYRVDAEDADGALAVWGLFPSPH